MRHDDGARPLQSSGDPRLDNRYRWAVASLKSGDAATARDLLQSVVEAAARWAPGWFALAEAEAAIGKSETAAHCFEQARSLDPNDGLGAGLRLALLRGGEAPPPSPAYVQGLFDQYAPSFDAHLTQRLGYTGPQALFAAIARLNAEAARSEDFACALDLGCGTGLAGRVFAPLCRRLIGVDLSPGMITQARRTGVYESLAVGDLEAFVNTRPAAEADLVIAADVFAYFSALRPPFRSIRRALASGGLFALTLQRGEGSGEAVLGPDLRFAFSRKMIEVAAETAHLGVRILDPQSTRREKGEEQPGWVVVLEAA